MQEYKSMPDYICIDDIKLPQPNKDNKDENRKETSTPCIIELKDDEEIQGQSGVAMWFSTVDKQQGQSPDSESDEEVQQSVIRKWIVDTGSSCNLVPECMVTGCKVASVSLPVRFNGVGGQVKASKMVNMNIKLNDSDTIKIPAFILKDAPAVVSA